MLLEILRNRFGFSQFRPQQEAVCQAVAEGQDALVVMPTGAGKSLCYQVPGLARGGVTLVISPLVALIEDQVHRLKQRGARADRIHSGRSREDSREVFRAYLKRELEFLFIAPERLAVAGFAEMLRKCPPSLIAVDEAHCISHWGHDFRPDYRLVGERLQGLPATPVLALTATATPIVQDDICAQLRLRKPRRFIHGFRRHNLAVHILESNPSEREERIARLLAKEGRLPAIVYAPTRKKAEELARSLSAGNVRCAAYHAGMAASTREKVQLSFLNGSMDVIVATVAFGMGIDKADVRTVVHSALPGSVEGYYQEIGRAGRDGLPSQAILLHSFSDRKTHEFFLERDYPESATLARIQQLVPRSGSVPRAWLQEQVGAAVSDVFEKALEKLWMHGGLEIDPEENVSWGGENWRKPYEEQRAHRLKQLDSMQSLTSGGDCRMLQLIRHFGDSEDAGTSCGVCDRCAGSEETRCLDELERTIATQILASLAGWNGQAAGRLFEEASALDSRITRAGFERVVSALARAAWLNITQEEFEKDGKLISFRRISLASRGKSASAAALAQLTIDGPSMLEKRQRPPKRKRGAPAVKPQAATPSDMPKLFERLRAWRLEEARRRGVPAFRILSDRVLLALCESLPKTEDDLLKVRGIGPKLVQQYGTELLGRLGSY